MDNAERAKKELALYAAWRRIEDSQPRLFELVVVKSFGGSMDWDWLEPMHDRKYFAENFGPTEFWMPAAEFKRLAPPGVAEHLRPLDKESNTRRLERLQKVAGVAEAVLEYAPNHITGEPSLSDLIDEDFLDRQLNAPVLEEIIELDEAPSSWPTIECSLPEQPLAVGFDHPNA